VSIAPPTVLARRGLVVGTCVALFAAVAACSSEDGSRTGASTATTEATATTGATGTGTTAGKATTSVPPEGSGATVPGITATTLPPIVPSGATKTNVACRKMYPVVTDAITAWNAAGASDAALGTATAAMSKAATDIVPIAKDSGDARLGQLTDATAAQLKAVVADYGAGRDVDGSALTKAENDLWGYCQTAR